MFDNFFDKNTPADMEKISGERTEDIKAAVMERIAQESEEHTMKKHRFLRPILIAAAAVSVSAVSLVTANAATDGAITEGITKIFTVFINGEEVEVEADYSEYEQDGMHIEQYEFELPEDGETSEIGYSIVISADGDGNVEVGTDPTDDEADISSSEEGAITVYGENDEEVEYSLYMDEDFDPEGDVFPESVVVIVNGDDTTGEIEYRYSVQSADDSEETKL